MDRGVEFISLEGRERIKKQIGELKLGRNREERGGRRLNGREDKRYEALYGIIYRIYIE